jgi:capsular polysaccharide biosynthesis protein
MLKSDKQSEPPFLVSADIIFTQSTRQKITFENVSGEKLKHQKRLIFPKLLTYQSQELVTLIDKSLEEDLLISKRRIRWLIRDILKHPKFILISFFNTRRFTFTELSLADLPIKIELDDGDSGVWVSRYSIRSGIFPSNLDESLEYDRLRNPRQFRALVVNSQSGSEFESTKLYRNSNYSFFSGPANDSQGFRVEHERFGDSEILHGRIAISGNRILQVSNVRKELIRREPMYLKDQGERLATLNTFRDLSKIEDAVFFGSNLNWFHFIVECLTRYTAIPQDLSIGTPVVLEKGVHANIVELCRILSTTAPILVGACERLPVKNLLLCRELMVENPLDSKPRIPALLSIRKRVLSELEPSIISDQPNEIYFFRRRSKLFRPLQNEKKLIELLQPLGVKFIFPEDCTLIDLIELLFHTKLIIIESGAAITNLMFAPEGITVIELTPPAGEFGFWESFLTPFGVKYFGVVGKKKRVGRKGIASDGYSINANEIVNLIKKINS